MDRSYGSTWRRAGLTGALAAALGTALLAAPAAAAPSALRTFSTSFDDTCTVIGRSYTVPAVVTGRLPAAVARGQRFRLDRLVFSARIPAALATQAYDLGARRAQLRLQVVHARGVGVTPEVVDVVPEDVVLPLPLRRARPIPFTTAGVEGLGGTFTAGGTPGTARLQAGTVRATITLLRADGSAVVRDEPVTCARPSPDVTVTTVRIT